MSLSINTQINPYKFNNSYNEGTSNNSAASGNATTPVSPSPVGTTASSNDKSPETMALKRAGKIECQTCKNRKYQDGSNDAGVSFKTPGPIDPGSSASVVMSHEQEHVRNETAKASSEGRKVVSQSVTLQTSVCPECGRVYVSGGETKTVTKADDSSQKNSGDFFGKIIDVRV